MKKILDNAWTKHILSSFSIFYAIIVYAFSFFSLFYTVALEDKLSFSMLLFGVTLFFGTIMIFTRKEVITKVVSMLMMPAILPILLFYFGEWAIIIPICTMVIVMFFVCGATERTKTILGTIFLLLYIFGALGYFLLTTLFSTDYKEVTIRSHIVSQSGTYRCYITDTDSNSTLGTRVYVQPNNYDISNDFVTFEAKGYKTRVYVDNSIGRKSGNDLLIEWRIEKRDDIVAHLLSLNPMLELNLSEDQLQLIKRKNTDKVYLSELTAEDYKLLGVKEEGDVMYIDGEVRFRYLIAVLNESFDISNRKIIF